MHIAIGCDHRGLNLKQAIIELLSQMGHSYEDFGCYNSAAVDYPDIGSRVALAVAEGRFDHGILICSTGVGMSMVANKVPRVRAALCHDTFSARRSREHNDANVLCLGESVTGQGLAEEIVTAYLSAEFQGGRHAQRLEKIRELERQKALTEIARSVAHDLNNSLSIILGQAQLAVEETDDPKIKRAFQAIEQGALNASRTVQHLQRVARGESSPKGEDH
ncbi:MAG: ribose 5-phosphate isomerase B [Chloroflexi bacterium]|nr:MAG: ribose 5-phosphate isomerase B [Chloroflexota bacterium]